MCYRKPVIPSIFLNKTRQEFGLAEEATVYLCCQAVSKFLPVDDDLFTKIAKRTPNAQFVFVSQSHLVGQALTERLEVAFAKAGLKANDFCRVLPGLSLMDYWNLHIVSDVFLDTSGWSGNNSTFEALACKLPVVTRPGKYMRGRHSYGILKQLGLEETIAADKDEYIDIAVRLGTDSLWRDEIVTRIVDGYSKLYSDTSSVRALESLIRTEVAKQTAIEQ